MKGFLQKDALTGLLLSLAVFCVYVATLAPTLNTTDGGELAAVVSTLGIAHPSGYPLFTLLGWVAAHLPSGRSAIWNLNLFVAALCSVAVFFFHRLFLFLLANRELVRADSFTGPGVKRQKKDAPARSTPSIEHRLSAAIGTLVLAFSATLWSQAVSFEVYALHLVFLSLLIFLFLRSIQEGGQKPGPRENRFWYGFSFALGLSFTNHMMTVLLAPAFLYLYFSTHGFGRNSWIKIGRAVFPFLIGLTPYLYLPWRASQKPLMNWGNPAAFESFWWHVSARQYRYQMFSSIDVAMKQLHVFLASLPSEFGYVPLLFAIPGLWGLFRHAKKMLVFSVLLFAGCLFYSVNYDIPEIPPYFLLAYVAIAIWILYGVYACMEYAKGRAWQWIVWMLCVAVAFAPLYLNYRTVDQSGDYSVEDYARNVLNSLEPGAVVYTDADEYFTSAAYYMQLVEGVRPDVAVIDGNLLFSPWYYIQLERRHPWLVGNSRPEIEAYVRADYEYERGRTADFASVQRLFVQAVRSILWENRLTHPLYYIFGIQPEYVEGFHPVPDGLAFRLYEGAPPLPGPPKVFSFRPFPRSTPQIEDIKTYYAGNYFNQGLYRASLGDRESEVACLRNALVIKPDFTPAVEAWNQLLAGH